METRRCLSCKGTTYKFNYHNLKYTREPCSCCVNGRVPKNSNDDDFGPFSFVQHLRTTDITRNNRVISETVDIHEDSSVDDVTLSLNGIYSIADLEAICAMVKRIKEAGKNINCQLPTPLKGRGLAFQF